MDLRNDITEVALCLFIEKGYELVKISEILEVTNISKGTFYYHYSNKEDILKEALSIYFSRLKQIRIDAFSKQKTLLDYLNWTTTQLDVKPVKSGNSLKYEILTETMAINLMTEVVHLFPDVTKRLLKIRSERIFHIEKLIIESKKRGEISSDIETSVLARNIMNIEINVIVLHAMNINIENAVNIIKEELKQLYELIRIK